MQYSIKSGLFTIGVALSIGGCRNIDQPQVVRVTAQGDSGTWQISVNAKNFDSAVSDSAFAPAMKRLHLHQGDLILSGTRIYRADIRFEKTCDWLLRYCNSNHVALYYYDNIAKEAIFRTPVYHWTAPFGNPRSISGASFYCEGQFLGKGTNGFQVMLQQIKTKRPKSIFLLGSLHDLYQNFGPGESPYEDQKQLLEDTLNQSGTMLIELDPLPIF